MKVSDFDYELPEELIAQSPIADRDHSRLLVYHYQSKRIEHKEFYSILDYLDDGDCLVLNDTKVLPARLLGTKENTGGKIEFVLLRNYNLDEWEVLVKPGRRAKLGTRFVFGDGQLKAEVIGQTADGNRMVRFEHNGDFDEILDEVGIMPLPPYIHEKLEEKERYQTVYAENKGSAAAPTAGLHFTTELLEKIHRQGIKIVRITLHVGLGTFRPVKVENIQEHKMHHEVYEVSQQAADAINECKCAGKKVIAVGTTSARTLESVADQNGIVHPGHGETGIFIYPGYDFKIVDSLITNFHLPKSTLLMLVCALAGKEEILNVYREAVKMKYRFFSFGDAMLLLK